MSRFRLLDMMLYISLFSDVRIFKLANSFMTHAIAYVNMKNIHEKSNNTLDNRHLPNCSRKTA